ncbi:MAG: hypothetical protein ACRDRT_04785, partial [Pseudonocardiaceae bacterium]
AAQRKAAIGDLVEGIRVVAGQFDAGEALGVRTDTVCTPGERGWPHDGNELYRSSCWVQVTTAYALDVAPLHALSGLAQPLAAAGWRSDLGGWTLTAGRGEALDLESFTWNGYHLEDIEHVRYTGGRDAMLTLQLQASTTPAPERDPVIRAQTGRGAYFGSTEGADWQQAWAKELTQRPYLLLVKGFVVFANQPW